MKSIRLTVVLLLGLSLLLFFIFNNPLRFIAEAGRAKGGNDAAIHIMKERASQFQNFVSMDGLVQSWYFDVDGDGSTEELMLSDGVLSVIAGNQVVWQTPEEWWVDSFLLGDVNNDGTTELNLLVWKEGSFGPQRPFWIENDNLEIRNHLFVYKMEKGSMKPVWQSSNLDFPNFYIEIKDINDDGENELIATEGSYHDPDRREITYWKWNGWGFSRVVLENN